jgi:hypothetical protein
MRTLGPGLLTAGVRRPPRSEERRTAERRSSASRAPWRMLIVVAHVAAAVSLLGADLTLLALNISAARGADPRTVYPAARLIATWIAAPLAVLSLGTGLLQGLTTSWGLLRHWWVTVKLVITALLTVVLLLVLVPALDRVANLATSPTPQLISNAQRQRLAIAPTAAAALLTLNIVLAIYKPRWRVRARRIG